MDRLTVENRQLAETSAVWQERARVLEERLALAAPAESPVAGQEAPPVPAATTDGPATVTARLRALASWVPLLVMLALAVVTLLLTLAVLALTP